MEINCSFRYSENDSKKEKKKELAEYGEEGYHF
jgi:hypothetical protein